MNQYAVLLLFLLCCSTSLFAQTLQDDFSDGDFTNNPIWTGDVADFVVTAGELVTDNLGNSATSYLSTPAAIQDSTTWEFYIRLEFDPSTSNQARVYLQADDADLTSVNDGYYLQIGASGSTDALELYRLDGGSATSIFTATVGAVATDPAIASVRIVRDAVGNWEVFADYAGGTSYVSEGTFTDATHTTGSHFGVWARYTTTRGNLFFFDNIFCSPLFVDVVPPSITSLSANSATELEVQFDEIVELTSANNAANYTLSNGANVSAAARDAVDFSLVRLTTSPLASGQTYTLTATGVEDLNNNATNGATANVTYVNVQPAAFQDIIINEIFADPSPQVGLPTEEYIELYNRSNKIIDLGGMVFNDGSNKTLSTLLLYPDSTVILTASSNVALFAPYGTTMDIGSLTLTNGGELLTLKDANNVTIDSVNYDDAWYQDPIKDDGGWSLELINPNLLCEGAANWIASTDPNGGTPGQQNSVFDNTPDTQAPVLVNATFSSSTTVLLDFDQNITPTSAGNPAFYTITNNTVTAAVLNTMTQVQLTLGTAMTDGIRYTVTANGPADCSGNTTTSVDSFDFFNVQPAAFHDLLITEIFADPSPQQGLPDAEFIELHNQSNKTIDLNGYTLFEATTRTLPSQLMRPGDYVIVCAAADAAAFSPFGTVVPVSNLSLTNSGELLQLYNASGATVDSVEYSDDWYGDDTKKDGGWSLALINPNLICKGGANWQASIPAAGGTPGAQNQVWDTSSDNTPPSLTDVRQFGPNQILLTFDDILNASQVGNTSTYSIDQGANIITVVVLSPSEVLLTLSNVMVDQTTYTVSITTIEDCVGNAASNLSGSFTYFEAGAADRYDIIINEIMSDPNPPVGLPELEYIELYNRSNKIFNLQGFTIQDRSSVVSTLPFFILAPGEYVTVYADGGASLVSFGNALPTPTFPDLNTSDEVILRDPTGEVIDGVAYELFWYQNADKDDGGWSLERMDPNRPCEGASNWAASQDLAGGTPAQANSILMNNPDVQAPDLLRAFPVGADSLHLFFSEALDDTLGADPTNYTLVDINGTDLSNTILSAELVPPFYNKVILQLSQPLVLGTVYTLTAKSNVRDCVGNPVGLRNEAQLALPEPLLVGDLILNEVLSNPVTGGRDFVELYNRSNKYLNANDLVFSNAVVIDGNLANTTTLQTRTVDADFLIAPQSYVVFTEGPEQVMEQYNIAEGNNFLETDLPTYDDKEGSVFLYAAYDSMYLDQFGNPQIAYLVRPLDLLDYTADFHSPLIDDLNGVSLERIDFEKPTNDRNNWFSGATEVGYATPGYQNSARVRNTIIGDDIIELPTTTVSPDGDGFEDVLLINYSTGELGYVATIDVYDAHGRLIRNLVNGELLMREGTLRWDGTDNNGNKARVGIHLLTVELFRPDGSVLRTKKTCVVAGRMN